MVVDEELKMMCDICSEGGQILGPYLKPMTHLIHTEYILAGRTSRGCPRRAALVDVRRHGHRQPGRERLPADQEVRDQGPRLLRRGDGAARPRRERRSRPPMPRSCCAPPMSRSTAGSASRPARPWSATPTPRTRWPRPMRRPAASCAPSAWSRRRPPRPGDIAALAADEDVLVQLGRRNQRLSRFWLNDQSDAEPAPAPGRQARGRPRRRGRLRPDAPARARRARHDEQHRRGTTTTRPVRSTRRRGHRRARSGRPARPRRRQDQECSRCRRRPAGVDASRSWRCAWATRCCAGRSACR